MVLIREVSQEGKTVAVSAEFRVEQTPEPIESRAILSF